MTKNIIIVVLTLACLVLTVYALVQQTEARHQSAVADENLLRATTCETEYTKMKTYYAKRKNEIDREKAIIATEAKKTNAK